MRKAESRASVTLIACIVTIACSRQKQNSDDVAAPQFQRGDRVLVESSAANFYEAQVLGVETSKLRVQALPSGDTALIPVSDVYRLSDKPSQLPHPSLAICSSQKERWFGCTITSADGGGAEVSDIDGLTYRLSWNQIIQPNALTELNLKRLFDKANEQHDFEQELTHAGAPNTTPGWRPLPGKAVLARIEGKWWSAIVVSEKREKFRVKFLGSDRQLEVEHADLASEPPYPMEISQKSRFALLRPTNPNLPWSTVRLVSVDSLESVIESVGSKRRTVPVRDICPLESIMPSRPFP